MVGLEEPATDTLHARQVTWSENIYALNDRAETLDLYKANRAERVSP